MSEGEPTLSPVEGKTAADSTPTLSASVQLVPNGPEAAAPVAPEAEQVVHSTADAQPSLRSDIPRRTATQVHVRDLLEQEPSAPPTPAPSSPVAQKTWLRRPPSRTDSHSHASGRPRRPSEPTKPTLAATAADLKVLVLGFLRILPFFGHEHPIRRWLKQLFAPPTRLVLNMAAKVLHKRGVLAGDVAYDLAVLLFKWIINLFFREIRPRGAHHIPKTGGIIFVAAPHANQFLDPLLLMSEVRMTSSRRVSFLIAEKSMKRAFVGFMARLMQAISTSRAADEAKSGAGTLTIDEDGVTLRGKGTRWTKEVKDRFQIMLGKEYGSPTIEVAEVSDDTTLKLKKPFADSVLEQYKSKNGSAGLKYKILPYVDQTKMYSKVYTKLRDGGCIGIFPEGGSHDRTDLLPLKAGVSIMALGALAENPELELHIVPVGLSYFHPHRFRSRAVVEFGEPVEIPSELVQLFKQGGKQKRDAVGQTLDLVFDGLKSVTVRAPDYETLMVVQACRRLYRPPGQQLSLGAVVELNRRFIAGYLRYKDEPRVQALREEVLEYNKALRVMGLRDHQIERVNRPKWKALVLLAYRTGVLAVWSSLALPGVILNAPMFIVASIISRKKAKEALAASTVKVEGRDVLATWKVLVSLGMAPPVYAFYTIFTLWLAYRYQMPRAVKLWTPVATFAALNAAGYSALRFGESGMDVYKSLRPLLISLIPGNRRYLERLIAMRRDLTIQLASTIDEFGPEMYEDFEQVRIVPAAAQSAPPSDRPSYSERRKKPELGPIEWLDDALFGWSRHTNASRPADSRSSESRTGSDEDDGADFDETVSLISSSRRSDDGTLRRRRSSGRLSRSQAELSKLSTLPTDADSPAKRQKGS